ncbi:WXG100 family type VII secretion target [Amycolatopsis sp. A133]|uniref:WXG100 family type VII secretion target n=1 Tax=Amycolatopsis sp. A133 TaxID=3064472 RepID=UPI0027EA1DE3|nr:WXG100 family type VII secretion target [Amycolatopsis sp. A133]MDQ7810870.1 WXG100 family type VII secretion target [Amycolatopsis sp. A133]
MSDGTITYDYPVIEECISMMVSKANEIENQAGDLESDVKRIMVDWKGTTADAYNQLANDLRSDIEANKSNLDSLRKSLEDAAERMKQADSSGAKGMH